MHFVARQFPGLSLAAENVGMAADHSEGVGGAGEECFAGDASEGCAEGLGGLSEADGGEGGAFDGGRDDLFRYEEGSWIHFLSRVLVVKEYLDKKVEIGYSYDVT